MSNEEDVRRICLSLPGVEEKPYERLPGFRVRGKLFARIRQKPHALVIMTPSVAEKEAMIRAEPGKFFQTPHYEAHHAVLVRFEDVEIGDLEDLLVLSWTLCAPRRLVLEYETSGTG